MQIQMCFSSLIQVIRVICGSSRSVKVRFTAEVLKFHAGVQKIGSAGGRAIWY
jgi:hypothetical protein